MNTVLDILYEAIRPDFASQEEQAILKREEAFLDGMEERLGLEDFSRLWDTLSQIGCSRSFSDFRLGFWLGANLVLEAGKGEFSTKINHFVETGGIK